MAVSIQLVDDLKSLLNYFTDKLNWQIDIDSFDEIDDITYDFDANDIGLKEEEFAKILSLRQLRPLVEDQPWGIFSIEFDSKRFEVTALRKILSGLVPKRRNKGHAVWDKHDLLFFCFWGEGLNRTIGIVHFEDQESGLPQIKMISCAPKCESFEQISHFENNLCKLHWPDNTNDFQKWERSWSYAFTTQYHQIIRESKVLTDGLAAIAKRIRSDILSIILVETPNGYVHLLFEKFRNTLIHDMTEEQFADMYAQTMVYGLFSARCMDSDEHFDPKEAIDHIPNTNPFLKSLLKECFSQNDSKLSFDELQLNDIVDLLKHTDIKNILNDFNRQTGYGKEDPVIYFYEGFLNVYESEQKKRRGVYYTPQPVVKFIVRAVDDILKNEFGFSQGLADTATKTVSIKRDSKRKIDGLFRKVEDTKKVSAIQILDPATGTGTFLRQTIIQIWENFKIQHKGQSKEATNKLWNEYVPEQLLPRLNGFELMMAPYAVAHMKLAMVLKETGYDFSGDERVKVFLTNSLEEPGSSSMQLMMENWEDPIATESIKANEEKQNIGINVVLGNPPYSVSSSNRSEWIIRLLDDYKKGLNERKLNLDDDYIKFIRLGQNVLEKAGNGILAYISNNSFLDGVTHRQMRKELLRTFDKVYILNLHGSSKKHETCSDGSKDDNVFDIQQGVSINIFVKLSSHSDILGQVKYADLYGSRQSKYSTLTSCKINDIVWSLLYPSEPYYFFAPMDFSLREKYEAGFSLNELFKLKNSGIKTDRDNLFIDYSKEREAQKINMLLSNNMDRSFVQTYRVVDSSSYKLTDKIKGQQYNPKYLKKIIYKPFDYQWIYYDPSIISRPGYSTMKHMLKENYGLYVKRGFEDSLAPPVFCCNSLICMRAWSRPGSVGSEYIFPLYQYINGLNGDERIDNFDRDVISSIEQKIGIKYNIEETSKAKSFSPINLFDYIYAVLHSIQYCNAYRDFIKIDFPRVPYPTNQETFWELVKLGGKLRELHLMESPKLDTLITEFPVSGSNEVEKITYKDDSVYINQTQYFSGVPKIAWEFYIGGYQPSQKWLKDRKGRTLSDEDLVHYQKIIVALTETDRIMKEIDTVIEF